MDRIDFRYAAAAAALVAVVATVLYVRNEQLARSQYQDTASVPLIARGIQPNDHLISGSTSSPVVLIAYSDLQCEYCRDFFKYTLPRLLLKYGESVATVYRHIPLARYPRSVPEAMAAECVGRVKGEAAFRSYVGSIYSDPSYVQGFSTSTLQSMANKLGVTDAEFVSCMADPAILRRVTDDAKEAAIAGLTIAPSFVVKSAGRAITVQGDSYSQLDTAIEYVSASSTSR